MTKLIELSLLIQEDQYSCCVRFQAKSGTPSEALIGWGSAHASRKKLKGDELARFQETRAGTERRFTGLKPIKVAKAEDRSTAQTSRYGLTFTEHTKPAVFRKGCNCYGVIPLVVYSRKNRTSG